MDIDKAKKLLERGYITPETFNRAYGTSDIDVETNVDSKKSEAAKKEIEQADARSIEKEKAALIKSVEDDRKRAASILESKNSQGIDVETETPEKRLELASRASIPSVSQSQQVQPTVAQMPQPAPTLVTDIVKKPAEPMPQAQPFAGLTAGYDLQQQALAQGALAGAAKAAETSAYLGRVQKDVADMRRANQVFQDEQSKNLANRQTQLDSELDRVSKLSIDPNRFWNQKDTGEKIIANIGLFLGAFGGAAGQGNRAAEMIERAISRDVSAQESDIANQARAVDKRRGILADMRDNLRDTMASKNAAIAAYLQDAQIKVQQISNKFEGPEVKAKAAQLIGDLEVKKQEATGKAMKEFMKAMPVAPNAIPETLTEEQRERFVPGYGLALTKEEGKAAREIVANFDSVKGNINELLALSNTAGSSVSPELRAKGQTIASILKASLRPEIVGPGAVTDREYDLLDAIVADPTKIFSLDANNKTRLNTLRERMEVNRDNKLRSRGLMPPAESLGFKPLAKK